jgi:hypothetical protein
LGDAAAFLYLKKQMSPAGRWAAGFLRSLSGATDFETTDCTEEKPITRMGVLRRIRIIGYKDPYDP